VLSWEDELPELVAEEPEQRAGSAFRLEKAYEKGRRL
jgi:hypothetical protein